jgi:5-methylcytosine-specific restriction endonuclease McrBC GTP-binding regulatory subunit McrB
MNSPIQKILFGSPGTGKSHKIDNDIIPNQLGIVGSFENENNVIKAVFHPEYTYGDFIGKLMPISRIEKDESKVTYNFYAGHFLRALGQAYKNIIEQENKPENSLKTVVLVIDEINRGNSSAIFGSIFQLLDRNESGWSNYHIDISEMEFNKLVDIVFPDIESEVGKLTKSKIKDLNEVQQKTLVLKNKLESSKLSFFPHSRIKIPPNLSILATMNTSDSSIYYMDSAFKRRWEWEFIDIDSKSICAEGFAFENREQWITFIGKLNGFIKGNHKYIRGIEDKQIGHFFIKDDQIKKSTIQNKLMFFLWDSVFNRDKKPLISLLYGEDKKHHDELITFGDFAEQVDKFINAIKARY